MDEAWVGVFIPPQPGGGVSVFSLSLSGFSWRFFPAPLDGLIGTMLTHPGKIYPRLKSSAPLRAGFTPNMCVNAWFYQHDRSLVLSLGSMAILHPGNHCMRSIEMRATDRFRFRGSEGERIDLDHYPSKTGDGWTVPLTVPGFRQKRTHRLDQFSPPRMTT
jgi:hypothetical protein